MNFKTPYLTEQIIAYIGNKRKLLDLIYKAMINTGLDLKPGLRFADVFSGSGIVSRFGKQLDFEVFSNDWEPYSYVLNKGYVQTNYSDILGEAGSVQELNYLIEKINTLKDPSFEDQYIARYYAPKEFDSTAVDFNTERLFYTRQNALTIDKIRNYLECQFSDKSLLKNILLSDLIYEAATHTNTSGVFKSFHKGFGGHSGDALSRILAPISLHEPLLIDSHFPAHIYRENACELIKKKELQNLDIAYLDPPYNQHQYGSNYHLLNTIARWDKIPVSSELNEKGILKEKAGIRHDWQLTRSLFCYRSTAMDEFSKLISEIDSKHILISYSTDGIISFDDMLEICRKKGKLTIVTNEYTKYRGGKQSNRRLNTNIEFILCINTSKKATSYSLRRLEEVLMRKKILLLFRQRFNENKLKKSNLTIDGSNLILHLKNLDISIESIALFQLLPPENNADLTMAQMELMYDILSPCVCNSKDEELAQIIDKIKAQKYSTIKLMRLLPAILRKLASKKNKILFYFWLEKIRALKNLYPAQYQKIDERIENISSLAERRFKN